MSEVSESGHHDLCFLSEPCSHEVPQHGFCSRQNTMCIHCERECICERLKQAENYARIAVMHTVDVVSYEQGQRDALSAAREAIAALVPSEFWEGIEGRPSQWWIVKAEAIAAIDALRKESND